MKNWLLFTLALTACGGATEPGETHVVDGCDFGADWAEHSEPIESDRILEATDCLSPAHESTCNVFVFAPDAADYEMVFIGVCR